MKEIQGKVYRLIRVPYGTTEVIISTNGNTNNVVILCNRKIFIKVKLVSNNWYVLGPLCILPDNIIDDIGKASLNELLVNHKLTFKNALLLRKKDKGIYDN